MCRSLVAAGHEVTLVVADGLGDSLSQGVQVRDVGRTSGRLRRMTVSVVRVLREALRQTADLYHIHDPELIPAGLLLRVSGRRVVFDAHEDLPKQLLGKPYLGRSAARALSFMFAAFERMTLPFFSGIISATPIIASKFASMHSRSVAVNNFPLLEELGSEGDWDQKRLRVAYVGAISRIRGVREVVDGLALVRSDVRLDLVGEVLDRGLAAELAASPGWSRVDAHGHVGRAGVRDLLASAMAGIVTFLPAPNHIDAQPNKMFEYMSAGLPVIASDFPLWREIIDGAQCGVCVDPRAPEQIARAVDRILADPDAARAMGARGRAAVLSKFNWKNEERVLLDFYSTVIREG